VVIRVIRGDKTGRFAPIFIKIINNALIILVLPPNFPYIALKFIGQ